MTFRGYNKGSCYRNSFEVQTQQMQPYRQRKDNNNSHNVRLLSLTLYYYCPVMVMTSINNYESYFGAHCNLIPMERAPLICLPVKFVKLSFSRSLRITQSYERDSDTYRAYGNYIPCNTFCRIKITVLIIGIRIYKLGELVLNSNVLEHQCSILPLELYSYKQNNL